VATNRSKSVTCSICTFSLKQLNTIIMRRTFTLAFLLLSLLVGTSFAQDPSSFIDRNEVDEFTGKQVVSSKTTEVSVVENTGEEVSAAVGFVVYVEGSYALLIDVRSESANFIGEDKAYFVVDGERYEKRLGQGESDMETEGTTVAFYERLVVELDEEFRDVLSDATRARMKAGDTVFNITPAVDDEIWAVEETAR